MDAPKYRLANALVEHAVRILPASRSGWAVAMRDGVVKARTEAAALRWSIACLLGAYGERVELTPVLRTRAALWTTLFALVALAARNLVPPSITLAYRLGRFDTAQAMAQLTPLHDYERFVPLIEATPTVAMVLWASSSVLFLIVAALLWRGRGGAFTACVAALGVYGATLLMLRAIPEYAATFTFAEPDFIRDYFIPTAQFILPPAVAALVWGVERARRGRARAPRWT